MNTPRQLMLIINPVSGTVSKRGLADRIEPVIRRMDFDVETRLTTCRGDATRLAREAVDRGMYGVLACGGDGTVNETATALCDTPVALGIIPAGSGNGLARHIGVPCDPMLSLDVIGRDNIVDCDYCSVNGRPFFCTFGVGFDAAVSDRFANQDRRGLMMYLKSAIDEYIHYTPQTFTIQVNGETITERAFLIACCNASQYGNNAFIAPEASITDGVFDMTIVHSGNPLSHAILGMDLLTGFIGRNMLVQTVRAAEAVIVRNDSGITHIDGEPVALDARLELRCHPGRLRMFTPGPQTRFMPVLTPLSNMVRDWGIAIHNLFNE